MSRQTFKNHSDLEVYKKAFSAAMQIFELSKKFPPEERYSLTDQIRRSSRSVCAKHTRKNNLNKSFLRDLSGQGDYAFIYEDLFKLFMRNPKFFRSLEKASL